ADLLVDAMLDADGTSYVSEPHRSRPCGAGLCRRITPAHEEGPGVRQGPLDRLPTRGWCRRWTAAGPISATGPAYRAATGGSGCSACVHHARSVMRSTHTGYQTMTTIAPQRPAGRPGGRRAARAEPVRRRPRAPCPPPGPP